MNRSHMAMHSFADVPTTCPTCQKSASLWLEFGSADRRREYYRCASCGRVCEVERGPRDAEALQNIETQPNTKAARTPPWWIVST
jgi:transposase-like protein